MRVLLTAFGTMGDVGPLLAIAEHLQALGDEAIVIANPYYRDRIERRGLGFRPCGEHWDPVAVMEDPRYTHKHFGPFNVWKDLFLPLVHTMFAAVRDCIDEAPTDAVINHIWCFGGHLAAEKAEIPSGMVSLAPLTWYSSADPSLYGVTKPPAFMHAWLMRGPMRSMMNGFFSRSLRKACAELGLPDHRQLFFSAQTDAALNLGLWSPLWRPSAPDDPPNAVICGFPGDRAQPPPKLDAPLLDFLAQGDPPVVLGLGSALPRHAPDVCQAVAKACLDLDARAVLVGADPTLSGLDDPRILVVPYAPYTALFPRARAIVHHAGIGTLAEVLAAGKPSLAIPFGNDQPDNAWRAERPGIARTIPRDKASTKRIKAALSWCIEDVEVREKAEALGRRFMAESDGAKVAAEAIRRLR